MPGRGEGTTGFAFREDRVREFFGDLTRECLQLIADADEERFPDLSEEHRNTVRHAQIAAKTLLEKFGQRAT
jgi:hypothetical protein